MLNPTKLSACNILMLTITGSPMWTDYSVMDRFETGRVYVVYQDKQVLDQSPSKQSSSVLLSTGSATLTHWLVRPTRLGLVSQWLASEISTLTASKVASNTIQIKIQATSRMLVKWPPSSSWIRRIIILNWPDCEGQLALISMHHGHTASYSISVLLPFFIFIIILVRPGGGCPVWGPGGSRSSLCFPRIERGRRQETKPGDIWQLCQLG